MRSNSSKSFRPAELPGDALVDESTLRGLEFRGTAFESPEVSGAEVDSCLFEGTRLPKTLDRTSFTQTAFIACDLANLVASESSILESSISGSRMTGASWTNGVIRDTEIDTTRIDLASFRFSTLKAIKFASCDLRQVDFQRAKLRNVVFEDCDLTGAQFSNVEIHGVHFRRCKLESIGGLASLRGVTVTQADLIELAWSMAKELGIKVADSD